MNSRQGIVPRPWSQELVGFIWLPRLIDKARAHLRGASGEYQFNSPLDRSLLRQIGMDGAEFLDLVRHEKDEARIGELVLVSASTTPEQREDWNRGFRRRYWMVLELIDVDEGHRRPRWYKIPFYLLVAFVAMGIILPISRWRHPAPVA